MRSEPIAMAPLLTDQDRRVRSTRLLTGWRSPLRIGLSTSAIRIWSRCRSGYCCRTRIWTGRWKTYRKDHVALPADAGAIAASESEHTTHFSVIDRDGNAVAATTTVNDDFGSGFVPPGTGVVVMNDEMDDFSIQPGVPNLYGLVGGEANAIAPGKRPSADVADGGLLVRAEGRVRLVVGAAGGPRIITSVFETLLGRLRFGMSLSDAVAACRFHHQWKPETLRIEPHCFSEDTLVTLRKLGYSLEPKASYARVHAIERFENGRVWGAPDVRDDGAAVAE